MRSRGINLRYFPDAKTLRRLINPKHEVFDGRVIAGTVVSLLGAVALSVSIGDVAQVVSLPAGLQTLLGWHWP